MMLSRPVFSRRSRYLDQLAGDPLFVDVPRHLVPALAQTLEQIVLPAAGRARFGPGDVLIVADGHGVVTRNGERVGAVRPQAVVDTRQCADALDCVALVATAPLRGWLVPRRCVAHVRQLAPAVDGALARSSSDLAITELVARWPRPEAQQRLPVEAPHAGLRD